MGSVQSLLATLKERRALVAVLAAVVAAAVVTALLVSRAADEPGTRPVTASDDATSSAEEEHEHEDGGEHEDEGEHEDGDDHEHDHVDSVDPDIDPADHTVFCAAFTEFAGAYSSAMETLNATNQAPDFLVAEAAEFRAVAAETDLEDDVRAGFEWFVDDVLRLPNDASTEEQLAWSTFLNSACPA